MDYEKMDMMDLILEYEKIHTVLIRKMDNYLATKKKQLAEQPLTFVMERKK